MTKDQRAVLVTNPGADLYGSDRMVLETARALVAGGLRVDVAVPARGPLLDLLTETGAAVIEQPTPVIRKSSLSPRGLLTLAIDTLSSVFSSWRLLRRTGAATVVVNTITTPLWFPLARLAGCRVVCHLHEAEGAVAAPVRWAMYVPLQFCHRVIANSAYTKQVLASSSRGLESRVVVIPNTVPGPEKVVPPRPVLSDEVRLLYVGRLSRRKGPDMAVAAAGLLRDRGQRVRLDIVGAVFPGNERYEKELRDLVSELDMSEIVHFHGFQRSVWPYFAGCDIVLVPSVEAESFGNTAVEAALAARPAVVSDIAGLTEATAALTSAELVTPGDPTALSDAVNLITSNWDRYAAAAVGDSTNSVDRFSADVYGRSLIHALGLDPSS